MPEKVKLENPIESSNPMARTKARDDLSNRIIMWTKNECGYQDRNEVFRMIDYINELEDYIRNIGKPKEITRVRLLRGR